MATMKSKLEGKAEVVRRNDREIRLIKAIGKETLKEGVSATICMGKLYDAILMNRRLYGSEEIRRFVNVALNEAERTLQDSRFKIQDSRFKIQDSKFKIQDSKDKIQDSRFKIQDSKFKIQDSKFKIQDSKDKIQDSGFKIQKKTVGGRVGRKRKEVKGNGGV